MQSEENHLRAGDWRPSNGNWSQDVKVYAIPYIHL